jgi:cytochrome P450
MFFFFKIHCSSSGEKWRKRRKLLTPAFHFNILHGFHLVHDRESQVFLEQIESFADSNEVFDIYPFLKRFALDVICGLIYMSIINFNVLI